MIQRLLHRIFGHKPIIVVNTIRAQGNVNAADFPDVHSFQMARFGGTSIMMMCPCGRAGQVFSLGREAPTTEGHEKEIAELRRMAGLE